MHDPRYTARESRSGRLHHLRVSVGRASLLPALMAMVVGLAPRAARAQFTCARGGQPVVAGGLDFTEKAAWLENVGKYMKSDATILIFDGQDAHAGLDRAVVEKLAEQAGFELQRHERLHRGLWAYELRRK